MEKIIGQKGRLVKRIFRDGEQEGDVHFAREGLG